MDKGTTIQQVVNVASAFKNAGVYVHTYLIYGFPTQTLQEIVDSLEIVRQLLKHELIDAGYWHRFSTTIHSPIGQNPEKYGLQIRRVDRSKLPNGLFAEYLIAHKDTTVPEKTMQDLGRGLHRALISYSTGIGIDYNLQHWFACQIPETTIDPDFIIQNTPTNSKKIRESREIRI